MRSTATAAAGLAGGAFLFEGLSNLFGAHHTGTFLGGGTGIENASAHEQPLFTHTAQEAHDTQYAGNSDYADDSDEDDLGDAGDLGDADDMNDV